MIKNKIKNILILFIILPVLASCAGTGTKSLSMINLNVDSDETAAFFVRKKRFVASAGLVKISLDGNEVGKWAKIRDLGQWLAFGTLWKFFILIYNITSYFQNI